VAIYFFSLTKINQARIRFNRALIDHLELEFGKLWPNNDN